MVHFSLGLSPGLRLDNPIKRSTVRPEQDKPPREAHGYPWLYLLPCVYLLYINAGVVSGDESNVPLLQFPSRSPSFEEGSVRVLNIVGPVTSLIPSSRVVKSLQY